MHVETMSRSPIGMCLPLDQRPSVSSNPHAFPPFPSPESECFPQWLQFDSLEATAHYHAPSYGNHGEATPAMDAQAVGGFLLPLPPPSAGSAPLERSEGSAVPCPAVEQWEDQRRPLPSFPAILGGAKRRALDLACITRATPTGLHRPYSPSGSLHSFSPPPTSGCFGHLSAGDYCWADQVNDNQVVVSQNEGLCMLVDSQETYSRNEDYTNHHEPNTVVMDIFASQEHHPHPPFAENFACLLNGIGGGGVKLEDEGAEGEEKGLAATMGALGNGGGIWPESEVEEEEEEEDEEEDEEEEEEYEEEEVVKCVEEIVEEEEEGRRRRGGWKRERRVRRNRRKQDNDSEGESSNVTHDVFLTREEDGECSLPNIPTTLVCRWSECNAIFGDQSALVKHIEKTHVDARSRGGGSGGSAGRGCSGTQGVGGNLGEEFACHWHLCPRRTRPFNARYKLLIHMRVHSGDKPNKCPYEGCPKAFSRLENLKIHQRSHTGERPYTCQFPLCPKAFSNSSDRAKHQRTHFDTKPYACQVAGCSKRYTDPSSLRKHVKNHSPKNQSQARRKTKSVDSTSSSPQNRESKYPPSTPPEMTCVTTSAPQDYISDLSSSSASINGGVADKQQFLDNENSPSHSQESLEINYSNGDIIGFSNHDMEDDLFFDCFQSLESVKPLMNTEKESSLATDLQNSAQFELSLDLDCSEVQQDFLEIGVLEKWGVTGTNIVECCPTDDTLDGDFLTIS